MSIHSTATAAAAAPETPQPMAHDSGAAALHALTQEAKASNLQRVAELAVDADAAHVAQHIRAVAAMTMAHLPANTSAATRDNAAQWQQWAVDTADGVAQATTRTQ